MKNRENRDECLLINHVDDYHLQWMVLWHLFVYECVFTYVYACVCVNLCVHDVRIRQKKKKMLGLSFAVDFILHSINSSRIPIFNNSDECALFFLIWLIDFIWLSVVVSFRFHFFSIHRFSLKSWCSMFVVYKCLMCNVRLAGWLVCDTEMWYWSVFIFLCYLRFLVLVLIFVFRYKFVFIWLYLTVYYICM